MLTEPETVPMTEEQRRQAVDALTAMISDWWRRQAHDEAARRRPAASDAADRDAANGTASAHHDRGNAAVTADRRISPAGSP